MADSREKKMCEILKDLRAESAGVQGAVLISSDAMPLASDMGDGLEEEVLSALASSLVAAGERVARDLDRGSIEHVYLRGDNGDLVVVKVNSNALLACSVDSQAKMGMTLLEVNRCARRLSEVI